MGQNQDKPEGAEQVLNEDLDETKLSCESGESGAHSGETTEGESSYEEEDGKKSDEPDCYHPNESPSYKQTITSIERHIRPCQSQYTGREVREGGAAVKEGGGEQGGGGWTAPLSPHETEKNPERTSGTDRLKTTHKLSKINKSRRRTAERLRASTKIRMEHRAEETLPPKDDNSGDANSFGHSEQDSMMLKSCAYGALTGSESLLVQDLNEIMMPEAGNEDIKLCAETVSDLTERKEPPPAQLPHPLENSLQKGSLLYMSDPIQRGTPKEKTEINEKEVTLKYDSGDDSLTRPKVTDVCDQETEMEHSHTDTAETKEAGASESAPTAALDIEPSSILEKLLKRNKTEATPSLAKIKEVHTDTIADPVDQEKILNTPPASAAAALSDWNHLPEDDTNISPSKQPEPNPASNHSHDEKRDVKQTVIPQNATSDSLCSQPAAGGSATCESSLAEPHYPGGENINSTDDSVKADAEIRSNTAPSESMSSNGSQSAVLHETTSCEWSGVIAEESKPSSAESTPKQSSGQTVNSFPKCNVEKTDSDKVGEPSVINYERNNKTSGSHGADVLLGDRHVVKEDPEDAGAPLVGDGLVITQESSGLSASTQPDLQSLNSENVPAEETDAKTFDERDSISMRDRSLSPPKPRPVSDLIKETIQLHEKLQHHDRPKPAEVKCPDEQAHSVKVAQMKAAFDSAQKSPDKTIERKPSVRRGKGINITVTTTCSAVKCL